ncbi:MAG TPA: hypothetical protein PLE97_00495 [Tenuifilaceae bacterium]|jgi:hypothetical protein|nr:hypothetical protein [Tenuifilaceae bacterium]HPS03800.1 hypothetical protein [Tenuifilaceae bacterium]
MLGFCYAIRQNAKFFLQANPLGCSSARSTWTSDEGFTNIKAF